jgi:hypothetical protein
MTAALILAAGLAALLYACVSTYRDAKRRERIDATKRPTFIVDATRDNAADGLARGFAWDWSEPCHLCAARLTTEAHYVGGARVVCPSCHALVSGGSV